MPTTPSSARTALVVEDDADIGKLLQWVLEREGFSVTLIADGGEAVRRVSGGNPTRLVLLVVMLTAKSQEADVVKALDAGASDYMVKPFQPAELRARVRRLVPA